MADKTVTVKPDGGGTYTSLNAALAGESANLVTNTCILTIECYASTNPDSTSADTGAGYTTSTSYYIKIIGAASEKTSSNTGEWSTSRYRLQVSAANGLNNQTFYCQFIDMQMRVDLASDYTYRRVIITPPKNTFLRCLFYLQVASGTSYGRCIQMGAPESTSGVKLQSCAFYSSSTTAGDACAYYTSGYGAGTEYVYNCTFKNYTVGATLAGNCTLALKNCGFFNCTNKTTNPGGGTISETTNSTASPTFASGKEFHLDASDTTWKDQGTDLSADSGRIDISDCDGVDRTGTWDIGADEYVSGAATLEQYSYRFRNNDGTDQSATFLAALNTGITQSASTKTRLRVLINATNDPESKQFQLEYRKQGNTTWSKV
jgi:hypothetical protein